MWPEIARQVNEKLNGVWEKAIRLIPKPIQKLQGSAKRI